MSISSMVTSATNSVTDKYAKEMRKRERRLSPDVVEADIWGGLDGECECCYHNTKSAAFQCMEAAYLKASSSGTYPALARQIYYAARPDILELTGKDRLSSNYFTQILLPDYLKAHPEAAAWNIAFDARGHLLEPHTGQSVPLGTLEIREHLDEVGSLTIGDVEAKVTEKSFPTCGPRHRYAAILFIEKEGFFPLFNQAQLAERYDIAIMSTKGMPVSASRELVDELCGEHDIPLLVLHDFDKSGFSILGTLQNSNRRYSYLHNIDVIDLGLRLADVEEYELESEEVTCSSNPAANLRHNGATEEEIEFLRGNGRSGQRVELNAFTSEQLIRWLEAKLEKHGIKKLVPDDETLIKAYRRTFEIGQLNLGLEKIAAKARKQAAKMGAGSFLRIDL